MRADGRNWSVFILVLSIGFLAIISLILGAQTGGPPPPPWTRNGRLERSKVPVLVEVQNGCIRGSDAFPTPPPWASGPLQPAAPGVEKPVPTIDCATPFPPSVLQVQPPPSCEAKSNPPTLVLVATEPHRLRFTSDCYYAPANMVFRIRFTDNTVAASGATVPDNVSVYASQDKAVWYEEDGQVLRSDQSAALFRGPEVRAPGTVEFDVPPLPAGTYYIQSDLSVNSMYATLVVSR